MPRRNEPLEVRNPMIDGWCLESSAAGSQKWTMGSAWEARREILGRHGLLPPTPDHSSGADHTSCLVPRRDGRRRKVKS